MVVFALAMVVLFGTAVLIFYFFALCAKPVVTRHPFERRKIVYRIVQGGELALRKEQRVFTRRARSLWRKEMLGWDTFRIKFRDVKNYGIFGIVVPENFDLDSDCLQELGFTLGFLNGIDDAAVAELPLRCCYARKLNQMRIATAFYQYYRSNSDLTPCSIMAEFRNRKQKKVAFVRPVSEVTGFWLAPVEH
jgi:hypothetical protein